MAAIESEAVRLFSDAEDDTERIGRVIGSTLEANSRLGLSGELGAGKTCLVRGVAVALGVPPGTVRSPSFPVVLAYAGGRLPFYHIDLFRQVAAGDDSAELREYLYGEGVAAVEWYERLAEPLVDYLAIDLTFVQSHRRSIVVAARGVGYDRALAALREMR